MTRSATRYTDYRSGYPITQSDMTEVASNIVFTDLPVGTTFYVGFNTFSDADGTPANATAGTVDISVKTAVSNQDWEEVGTNYSMVDLTTLKIQLGPLTAIRAVPDTAISGNSVSHYRMVIYAE